MVSIIGSYDEDELFEVFVEGEVEYYEVIVEDDF